MLDHPAIIMTATFTQDFDNPITTKVYQCMRIISPLVCAGTALALWIKIGHHNGLSLFSWHPWLMTFAWFICVAFGLLSFKARALLLRWTPPGHPPVMRI